MVKRKHKPNWFERGGVGKKIVCGVSSFALAFSMIPSAAFAATSVGQSTDLNASPITVQADDSTISGNASAVEGGAGYDSTKGAWYSLPTGMIGSFQHSGLKVNGSDTTYSYRYLTSGIERVVGGFSQSLYYLMGINGVNFDRCIRPTNWQSTTKVNTAEKYITTDAVSAAAGIMGTAVNVEPDEYLWNSCYRLGAGQNLADQQYQTGKEVYIWTSNGNPSTYPTINVVVEGTEYSMPNVIYYEANFISNQDTEWSKPDGSIEDWVKIENKRSNRPNSGTYDPTIASWETNSGGIHFGAELMYSLADAVDATYKKTKEAADADSSKTVLVSRYVDPSIEDTDAVDFKNGKFASASDLARSYEDFAKATQYRIIDLIANEGVQSKVTAVICGYQPAKDGKEAAYACRIYDPAVTGLNNDSANFGGRLANSLMNISTDINTVLSAKDIAFTAASGQENYVRWYPASTIAKTADAIFVCDCPYANNRATYLAQNSDGNVLSIYSVDNATYDLTQNENVNPLVTACGAEGSKADLYYKYPNHLFGVWYAQGFENCWMAPLAASYLYGDKFTTPENIMAYAARTFWHIKDANIDGVLQATCSDISMPGGKSFDKKTENYAATVDDIISKGNAFYLKNSAYVDMLNCGDLKTHSADDLKLRATADDQAKAKEATFDLKDASFTVADQAYTGQQIKPTPVVTYGGRILTKDTDYTLDYGKNNSAGNAAGSVTINAVEGSGFTGTKTETFNIKYSFAGALITLAASDSSVTYTGSEFTPKPTSVRLGTQSLKDTDYTFSYKNNKDAGTATITVTPTESTGYTGTATKTFTIKAADLTESMISVADQTYTGSAIEPEVTVEGLTADTDYTVAYSDNTNAGDASVTVTCEKNKNYTGSVTKQFKINAKAITDDMVGAIADQAYTGSAIEPEVTVNGLVKGTDYTVAYENNKNAGQATAKVTGQGNYSGTVDKKFTIAANTITSSMISKIDDQSYTGAAITPAVTVTGLTAGTDYDVAYSDNTNIGVATVTVTGKGNYAGSTATASFKIVANAITADMIAAIADQVYSGSAIEPAVTVTGLTAGTDYDVLYSNNTNAGSATVVVLGKGKYAGSTAEKSFNITAAKISSVKVSKVKAQKYTGKSIKPKVTVTYQGKTLTKGTDYKVSYKNNKKKGKKAQIVIKAKSGNFTGSKTIKFTIK